MRWKILLEDGMPEAAAGPERVPPASRTAIVLSLIFLFDLFWVGQGLISLFIAFFGIPILTVGAIWSALRKQGPWARSRLLRAGMYLLFGAATVAAGRLHVWTATSRAQTLIVACQAYKQDHAAFPQRLDDLVPKYLPSIPRAKYTLMWGEFTYRAPTLSYVAMPPVGRRLYNLEEGRWSSRD
jgi:hypothetical protein